MFAAAAQLCPNFPCAECGWRICLLLNRAHPSCSGALSALGRGVWCMAFFCNEQSQTTEGCSKRQLNSPGCFAAALLQPSATACGARRCPVINPTRDLTTHTNVFSLQHLQRRLWSPQPRRVGRGEGDPGALAGCVRACGVEAGHRGERQGEGVPHLRQRVQGGGACCYVV